MWRPDFSVHIIIGAENHHIWYQPSLCNNKETLDIIWIWMFKENNVSNVNWVYVSCNDLDAKVKLNIYQYCIDPTKTPILAPWKLHTYQQDVDPNRGSIRCRKILHDYRDNWVSIFADCCNP